MRSFLLGLLRRWYIVLVGVLLSALGAGYLFLNTPPQYQRSASVLLMPGEASVPEDGNVFLNLGGLGQAAEVLLSTLTAPAFTEDLVDDRAGASVTVVRAAGSSGPLLNVFATADSDEVAEELVEDMVDALPVELERLQVLADVPDGSRITSMVLGYDDEPVIVQKTRLQLTAIAGIAGVVATIIIAGLADGLIAHRRRRRSDVASSRPASPTGPVRIEPPIPVKAKRRTEVE